MYSFEQTLLSQATYRRDLNLQPLARPPYPYPLTGFIGISVTTYKNSETMKMETDLYIVGVLIATVVQAVLVSAPARSDAVRGSWLRRYHGRTVVEMW